MNEAVAKILETVGARLLELEAKDREHQGHVEELNTRVWQRQAEVEQLRAQVATLKQKQVGVEGSE